MHKSRAYLYLHISVFLFGFTAILGKLISLDHFGLVWNRMWIALPLFLVIPGFISHLKAFSFKKAMLFLSIGILVAAHWITFYGSIKIGNSASLTLASLGLASWFTSIIEPIVQKTKINKVDMGFGLLAVLGITLIAFSQDELDPNATQSQFLLAIIWGIISALLATLFSVFNAKYAKKESPLLITFFEMLGGFLFLSIIYLLIKDQAEMQHYLQINNVQLNVPNIDWKWLLLLGVLCTTGAFVLNVTAMRVVSAFTANVAINLEPVYGIILAFFIFNEGESFNYLFYVGTLIILSTVFAQSYYSFIKKKSMDINQIIKERRSTFPKEFNGEVIDDSVIEQLLENAQWAPSHHSTYAWTFRVFSGESKDRLFDFWHSVAFPTKYEKLEFNQAKTSHVLIITVHDKGKNPLEEEIASTACAVQNIYLGLSQFPNVGGYWGTGNGIYEPHFHEFIKADEDEYCMGYFLLGKVDNKRTESQRPRYKKNVIWMDE